MNKIIARHTPYAFIIGIIICLVGEQSCSAIGLEFRPGLSRETTSHIEYLAGVAARLGLASCMIRNGVNLLVRDAFNDDQTKDIKNTKPHASGENNIETADESSKLEKQSVLTRPAYMSPNYYYRKGLGASLIFLGMVALLAGSGQQAPAPALD